MAKIEPWTLKSPEIILDHAKDKKSQTNPMLS